MGVNAYTGGGTVVARGTYSSDSPCVLPAEDSEACFCAMPCCAGSKHSREMCFHAEPCTSPDLTGVDGVGLGVSENI